MGKKLIFFDADDTLVPYGSESPPSPAVCAALAALRRDGHKTFLCTGRTLCDIGPGLLNAGFDGIVAGAGAYISLNGVCIRHSTIPLALLRKTAEMVLRCRVSCVFEGTYGLYYIGQGSRQLPWDFPRIEQACHLTGEEKIEKFTAHLEKAEEFEPLRSFLAQHYEIYSADSGLFHEMALRDRNKASAIRFLCDCCGVPLQDTVAFGDSRNDIGMLQTAGVGVAMGNAPADVQAHAALVTGTVAEDGVAEALHRMGLTAYWRS